MNKLEKNIFKEVCEKDFEFFCKQFLKIAEPETKFIWNWHMSELCRLCVDVYFGVYKNLDIHVPPRTAKSLIVNVLFPCWVWTFNSSCKFLSASHSYDLSVGFNIKRRDVVTSDLYQSFWKIKIKEDVNTTDRFANVNGGMMRAVSALGKVTGDGADILLSDDLIDALDAFSRTKRKAVIRWYFNAFYNRVNDASVARRININQRLHKEDLSSALKEKDFKVAVFEMIKTGKKLSNIKVNDERKIGELLFPERFSFETIENYKKNLGSYGFSSQYQQSPTPIGGGIIKEKDIRYWENYPTCVKKIIVADLTFKGSDASDYVSLAYWGADGNGNKYLLDFVRGKWSYLKTKEMFKEFCEINPSAIKWIEDKANGSALLSDLKDEISGLRAWPKQGSKFANADKLQRLFLCQSEFELGKIFIPIRHRFLEEYLEELLGFTEDGSTTGHDDMVDTTTMGILELKEPRFFVRS